MRNIVIYLLFSLFAIFSSSAQNKIDLSACYLTPDMSTHYDRLMEHITLENSQLFHSDINIDLLLQKQNEEPSPLEILKDDMVTYAKKFLGKRYRSGGKGPSAFDCSGFTSFVFQYFGFNLLSSSGSQSSQGEVVNIADAQIGDLIFFSGRRGGKRVGHVGMVIEVDDDGNIKFIHASSSKGVVIQSYPDGGYYSKRFLSMRRIIG